MLRFRIKCFWNKIFFHLFRSENCSNRTVVFLLFYLSSFFFAANTTNGTQRAMETKWKIDRQSKLEANIVLYKYFIFLVSPSLFVRALLFYVIFLYFVRVRSLLPVVLYYLYHYSFVLLAPTEIVGPDVVIVAYLFNLYCFNNITRLPKFSANAMPQPGIKHKKWRIRTQEHFFGAREEVGGRMGRKKKKKQKHTHTTKSFWWAKTKVEIFCGPYKTINTTQYIFTAKNFYFTNKSSSKLLCCFFCSCFTLSSSSSNNKNNSNNKLHAWMYQ